MFLGVRHAFLEEWLHDGPVRMSAWEANRIVVGFYMQVLSPSIEYPIAFVFPW